MTTLDTLLAGAPAALDLTDGEHLAAVTTTADAILATDPPSATLDALEGARIAAADTPLGAHVAIKLARSRGQLATAAAAGPLHVSVVFAVYREHQRILTPRQHPHGEDFLRRKVAQLRWLTRDLPGVGWDLTIVDDGCPEGSGRLAQTIAADLDAPVEVRLLADAIAEDLPVVRPLTSTDQSRKGGAIQYGMWAATQTARPRHVVAFTDADLSTHLGQLGLLVAPILAGADAAIGSRREPTSVVVKQGVRNTRGKLFIYLWKRLLPPLAAIVDTQCGFKAWHAEVAREIVMGTLERGFAFDIELLLRTELRRPGAIRKVPVAWIDSEAASTTTDLDPYRDMLQAAVGMARHYLPPDAAAAPFAALIEALEPAAWDRLVAHIPAAIAGAEPATFGDWAGVSADELRAAAGV